MASRVAIIVFTASELLGFTAVPVVAHAYHGAQYAAQARVTMTQARAHARKLVPGTIRSGELEKERGGSGLRYSFDIKTRHGLREVGIDAVTGKVLENSVETPSGEAREERSEH